MIWSRVLLFTNTIKPFYSPHKIAQFSNDFCFFLSVTVMQDYQAHLPPPLLAIWPPLPLTPFSLLAPNTRQNCPSLFRLHVVLNAHWSELFCRQPITTQAHADFKHAAKITIEFCFFDFSYWCSNKIYEERRNTKKY